MSRVKIVNNKGILVTEGGAVEHTFPEGYSCLRIGNSIGGYVAFNRNGNISLSRVSGGQIGELEDALPYWTPGWVYDVFESSEVTVIKNGDSGMWATSSGAARNGIFHLYKVDNTPLAPLRELLRKAGISTSIVKLGNANIISEGRRYGNLCGHTTHGGTNYEAFHNGKDTEVMEPATFVESHINGYHIGCCASAEVFSVAGHSYLVVATKSSRASSVQSRFSIEEVWLKSFDDVPAVIEICSKWLGRN